MLFLCTTVERENAIFEVRAEIRVMEQWTSSSRTGKFLPRAITGEEMQ